MGINLKKWRGEVLTTFDFNGIKNHVLSNMLNHALDGIDTSNQENLILRNSISSGVDTTNTTAFQFGTFYLPSSTGTEEETTFDDFEDGTVASFWTQNLDGDPGTSTITETGGELQLRASVSGGYIVNTYIEQNAGTSMIGKTVVISMDYSLVANASTTARMRVWYKDASGVEVLLYDNSQTGTSDSATNAKLKFQPSSTVPSTSVEVFIDTGAGYVSQGDTNISTLIGEAWLKIDIYADDRAGGSSANSQLDLKHIWVDNYQDSLLVTNNETTSTTTLPRTFISALRQDTTVVSDVLTTGSILADSVEYSADNGASYEAGSEKELFQHSTNSSSLKTRWTLSYDNTTGSAMTASHVNGFAIYYG